MPKLAAKVAAPLKLPRLHKFGFRRVNPLKLLNSLPNRPKFKPLAFPMLIEFKCEFKLEVDVFLDRLLTDNAAKSLGDVKLFVLFKLEGVVEPVIALKLLRSLLFVFIEELAAEEAGELDVEPTLAFLLDQPDESRF